jgi:hypothetical protein
MWAFVWRETNQSGLVRDVEVGALSPGADMSKDSSYEMEAHLISSCP